MLAFSRISSVFGNFWHVLEYPRFSRIFHKCVTVSCPLPCLTLHPLPSPKSPRSPSELTHPGPVLPNSKREAVPGNDRVCHTTTNSPLANRSYSSSSPHRSSITVRSKYRTGSTQLRKMLQCTVLLLFLDFTFFTWIVVFIGKNPNYEFCYAGGK